MKALESNDDPDGYGEYGFNTAMKPFTIVAGLVMVSEIVPLSTSFDPRTGVAQPHAVLASAAHAASPLAQSLQGKPVVVEIYASWCGACETIKPTLQELQRQEGASVHWLKFDVSNAKAAQKSANRAKQLGLREFYQQNRSQTSLVSILNPETGTSISTFRAQHKIDPYVKAIETTRSMIHH